MKAVYPEISELLGKTITEVVVNDAKDDLQFFTTDGCVYRFFHEQDCCENVDINDIIGDLDDLVGVPLTMAEVATNSDKNPEDYKPHPYQESFTWTFYKFATIKGYVTIRWYGESNGYYGEEVTLTKSEGHP